MQHGAKRSFAHLIFEDAAAVVVGVAGVNDQWQAGRAGAGDVRAKAALLGLVRVAHASAAKSRAACGMPRLSSSFAEDSGMTGCASMAICRMTSDVTYNTVFWRCGPVFASAHGASPAK